MEYGKLKDGCVQWIRGWFEANGPKCCAVLGMSGGKDSTVAAALCAEALGKDRVIGVSMPQNGQSLNGADEICRYLGIRYINLPIGAITDECGKLGAFLDSALNGEGASKTRSSSHTGNLKYADVSSTGFSNQTLQNIPPRIRMTVLYAVAQTCGGMVANTCNLSEDYIGYATLYGDAAGSFAPLGKLVVREIRGIGHALGIPSAWVDKTPDDGLPCSCPDEEKFGFTYDTLDRYIREGICEDAGVKAKIDSMHLRNLFKTEILHIPAYEPQFF